MRNFHCFKALLPSTSHSGRKLHIQSAETHRTSRASHPAGPGSRSDRINQNGKRGDHIEAADAGRKRRAVAVGGGVQLATFQSAGNAPGPRASGTVACDRRAGSAHSALRSGQIAPDPGCWPSSTYRPTSLAETKAIRGGRTVPEGPPNRR